MIVKLHKWTKLPIKMGEPLNFSFGLDGRPKVVRPKRNEKHNAFAACDITERGVLVSGVNSPIDISLVSNWKEI